ncbi:MAG TPA: DUF309 domain-containing protein [Thermoanaerobaculia bacterium]|nr:DUF309 domain-containing protein [Thermoanaerobaculia bacterium]
MTAELLHPVLADDERLRLILEGVELFNGGEHFLAHEAWETVWRSTTPEPADLWRGLIQVAAGLYHHLERGKPAAARRVLARGRRRVEAFGERCCGLELAPLVAACRAWEAWLEEPAGAPPPLPRIALSPPRTP